MYCDLCALHSKPDRSAGLIVLSLSYRCRNWGTEVKSISQVHGTSKIKTQIQQPVGLNPSSLLFYLTLKKKITATSARSKNTQRKFGKVLGQGARVRQCPSQRTPGNSPINLPHWACPLLWPLLLSALEATLFYRPAHVRSHRAAARFPLYCPQTTRKQEQSTMAHPWHYGLAPSHCCPALHCPREIGHTLPAQWGRPRLKGPTPSNICHLLASHVRR